MHSIKLALSPSTGLFKYVVHIARNVFVEMNYNVWNYNKISANVFHDVGCRYSLEFDGDEEEGKAGLPTKTVPFYHVVQLPHGHR